MGACLGELYLSTIKRGVNIGSPCMQHGGVWHSAGQVRWVGRRVGPWGRAMLGRRVGTRLGRRVGPWGHAMLGRRVGSRLGRRVGCGLRRRVGSLGRRAGSWHHAMLGRRVGSRLGRRVGCGLGRRVGCGLRRWVGSLGRRVGSWHHARLGRRVGSRLGRRVGCGLGRRVGCGLRRWVGSLGRRVGSWHHARLGRRVGSRLGRRVGCGLGMRVGCGLGRWVDTWRARLGRREGCGLSRRIGCGLRGSRVGHCCARLIGKRVGCGLRRRVASAWLRTRCLCRRGHAKGGSRWRRGHTLPVVKLDQLGRQLGQQLGSQALNRVALMGPQRHKLDHVPHRLAPIRRLDPVLVAIQRLHRSKVFGAKAHYQHAHRQLRGRDHRRQRGCHVHDRAVCQNEQNVVPGARSGKGRNLRMQRRRTDSVTYVRGLWVANSNHGRAEAGWCTGSTPALPC